MCGATAGNPTAELCDGKDNDCDGKTDENRFIMGDPLIEDGKDISIDVVHNNRLVRLCCPMCVRRFNAKTDEYLKQLDEMIIEAQRKDYPLKTCVVAGQELGSMGEPVEMIVAGRLIRLCCAACEDKVQADPAKYLAKIDKAWQDKGMFMPEKTKQGK